MGKQNRDKKNKLITPQRLAKNYKKQAVDKGSSRGEKTSYDLIRIVCCTVALLCLGLAVFAIAREAYLHNSVEDTVTEEVEISNFRSMLLAEIEKLSKDGRKYTLDEDYYNEEKAKIYVSTLNGVDASAINAEHIASCIMGLFTSVMVEEGDYYLIQKDYLTLIAQCEDKAKMNELDYKYMGITNDEIAKQSKGFYISQNDPRYLKWSYGSSNVNMSGCGPISLTMAVNYVSGAEVVTPEQVVQWANENNMYEENSGTRWALMREYPAVAGVKAQELYTTNAEVLANSITEGQVLIISMNEGHFTDSGHFIVITGIKDGKATVLDPASIYRSLQKWDVQVILEESNNYFWKIYR